MHCDPETTTSLRLQRLIEANQALASVESLDTLLPKLLRFAQEVTDAEASSILMYKPETQTLEFTLAYNEQAGTAESIINRNIELRLGEGIAGTVAKNRTSIIVADARKDSRFYRHVDKMSGFETRSILCAPVMHQEELLGVVQVLNAKEKEFFDEQDLLILESFSHLAAVALIRSRLMEDKLRQERMQAQLDAAARIQSNFLPRIPDIGNGHEIFAVTQPAIFIGGDFYDLIPLGDGSLLACVADVSGKGLPAALIGATLWTTMRTLSSMHESPAMLLQALNTEVLDVLAYEMFATMICCRYWPENRTGRIALAGHLPPLHVTSGAIESIDSLSGLPLGIDPGATYSESGFTLEQGESLLLYTDGITEARDQSGEFYGKGRLESLLQVCERGPWGPEILKDIEAWQRGADANDDLTIVEIYLHP